MVETPPPPHTIGGNLGREGMAGELSGFRKTGMKGVLRSGKLLGGWGMGPCKGL